MSDLVIIVPSRGRPGSAWTLAAAVRDTRMADTELVFVVDSDDPTAGQYAELVDQDLASVIRDDHANMNDALNKTAVAYAAMDKPPFAIAFMGDDHLPRTVGWDRAYVDALEEMGTGMAYGNDLLKGRELPTQVAMTTDIVRALGYMAPPALIHLYLDNFWLALGRTVGCIRYLPQVVVEHRHPTAGKARWDEGYRRVNDQSVYSHDAAAFNEYLDVGFQTDVDKVRKLMPAMEWKLFSGGPTPFVSTAEFHADRDRAPHLEQEDHRPRLLAAAEMVADAALRLDDNATVSDLGCGDGGLLSLLEIPAWGYDFQPTNKAGWAERGVTATALDVFGDRDSVDVGRIAVMTEVLEHIADPHEALRWVSTRARFLVASSPRFERPGAHVPEHAWAWNEGGFSRLISNNGWTILRHEMVGSSQLVLAESSW